MTSLEGNCMSIIEASSSFNNPTQQTSVTNLVCGVCGAPAPGFHFGQITCESCKAFFRRNALRNRPNLQCRYTGSCVINLETRRHCTYCRLKKCFDINMRKEWIQTDEEKELKKLQKFVKEQRRLNRLAKAQQSLVNLPIVVRKKKRLKNKRMYQDLVIQPMYTEALFRFKCYLSDEDRILLNNVTNAYQLIDEQAEHLRREEWTSISSIGQFVNRETEVNKSLINFYKSIPDFNQLDIEDRVLLIKSNLMKIISLHYVLIYKFQEHPKVGEYMSKWISVDFYQRASRAFQRHEFFMEHPLVLKLTLIVFIFSMNLSAPYGIDSFDDYSNRKIICEIQEFYTTVLWRYLNYLFDSREAIQSMVMIMRQILQYQVLISEMEVFLRQESERHTFNELESSLFRLTC